ncbi:MAG: GNAT family N-acetyltransferase [Bacteroidota bacterium]
MEVSHRLLTPNDEAVLWTALYHALHVPPGADPFPADIVHRPDLALYVAGWMQRPGDLGVAAESPDGPVGAAWLRCWPGPPHGYGFVDTATPELSMALLPAYRGRGVGTALLRRLLAEAAGQFDGVSLSVSASNPARRLYERAGFVVLHADRSSVTMVKRFDRP